MRRTTLKQRWKEAIKLLRTVRNNAYDHRAVHLLGTLVERYHNLTFSESEIAADPQTDNAAKIRRLAQHLVNVENMRISFRVIKAAMLEHHAGGLSKLSVPSGVKNHKVASRYCDEEGNASPAQLTAMAQSDKTSVAYATILDCNEIEAELTRYNREWLRQAKDTPFGHVERVIEPGQIRWSD